MPGAPRCRGGPCWRALRLAGCEAAWLLRRFMLAAEWGPALQSCQAVRGARQQAAP